jgi:secreted trypsin-like serine protease
MSVRSGSVDVNGGERHQVTKIVMHEDYDEVDSWNNDIAVLEVQSAV